MVAVDLVGNRQITARSETFLAVAALGLMLINVFVLV